MRKFYLLFSVLLVLLKISAYGTNYYVSATTGSDSNNGLSVATPFATITKFSYSVNYGPGDTIFVMNGNYTSTSHDVLRISRSGTASQPIVFKNYPGHTPLINLSTWNGILVTDAASYIVIEGFKVRGANSQISLNDALNQPGGCANRTGTVNPLYNGNGINVDGRANGHCHHITIRNNEVYDCGGGGVTALQSDYINIENNVIYNNSWYTIYGASGISILNAYSIDSNTGFKINIKNNIVHHNRLYVPWVGANFGVCAITDGNGIIYDSNNNSTMTFAPYNGKVLIENNISYQNGGRGIHIFRSDNALIRNNTVYQNCQSTEINDGEITVITANNVSAYNNIMYANPKSGGRINSISGSSNFVSDGNILFNSTAYGFYNNNDKFIDPAFADAANGNFTLLPTSGAINAGTTVSGQYAPTDIIGTVRPIGATPDIGAYEFTGTVPVSPSFSPGNIVALRIGDGASSLSTNGGAVNLLEFSTAGIATGLNIPLTNASPSRLTIGGASYTFDGQLNLSSDGRYLSAMGYDAAAGSASSTFAGSTKVIARIDNHGTVDYSTRIPGTTVNSTCAVSSDGVRFYYTGGGGGSATRTAILGSATGTYVSSDQLRSVGVYDNLLYSCALNSAGNNIIYYTGVDPSFPTSTNRINYPFPGFPITGHSYQSFALLDQDPAVGFSYTYPVNKSVPAATATVNSRFDLLYCSDINLGLVKFYYNGTTWVFAGSYNPPSATGVSGGLYSLNAKVNSAGQVVIYAVKGSVSNNNIVMITDNSGRTGNISSTVPTAVTVTSAGNNYVFKGIAFSPAGDVTTPPVITSISPASGVAGSLVTITGSNLQHVNAVSFGGAAASSFTEISPNSLTAIVGKGASGNVSVTTPNGTATIGGFTYRSPQITSFSPVSAGTGTEVTITGTDLDSTSAVTFGNVNATVFTRVSGTTVKAIVGAGASGDVSLTTPGGTAVLSNFTFIQAPAVTSAEINLPNILIKGVHLSGTTAVNVNGNPVSTFSVISDSAVSASITGNAVSSITILTNGGNQTFYTSVNNDLAALTASNGQISPAFMKDSLTYRLPDVASTVSTVSITPTLADSTASLTVNGNSNVSGNPVNINLVTGNNLISITVTAQNGISKTYKINVIRLPSSNAALAALMSDSGSISPAFSDSIYNYTLPSVDNTTDHITITAIRADSGSVVKINGVQLNNHTTSSVVALIPGNNTINVLVTAQDGITTRTYAITVIRSKLVPVISFDAPSKTYGDADFTLTATRVPIAYTSDNMTVATVYGNQVHIVGAGVAQIIASQPADSLYDAAQSVTGQLTVNKKLLNVTAQNKSRPYGQPNPVLTFNYKGFITGEDSTFLAVRPMATTTATSSSLPGDYPITVGQGNSANYDFQYAGATLTVNTVIRVLTFSALSSRVYGSADFNLGANVNTGDPVNYNLSNNNVISVSNGLAHIIGVGSVDITASVSSKAGFNDVSGITQHLVINKAPQYISFSAITPTKKGTVLTLNATSTSGLPVTVISSNPNVAAIGAGLTANLLRNGTTFLTALQLGNNNYFPAVPVVQTLDVKPDGEEVSVNPAVSPNGDGQNDFLFITGIQNYRDNTLIIMSSIGLPVFQRNGYNNSDHVFDGHTNTGKQLPAGTYLYALTYQADGKAHITTGYIVLRY